MTYLQITQADEALIIKAEEVIRANYVLGKHRVGSAVRASSGKVYTGIHLNSGCIDVCAEWVAMGSAMTAGEREIECIVAVFLANENSQPEIISPCGACRELLRFYSDNIRVIFTKNGRIRKRAVKYLLPEPYIPPSQRSL